VDWLISTVDSDAAPQQARALLEEHLSRHAVDVGEVPDAVAAADDLLRRAVDASTGHPLHLRLDWSSRHATLDVGSVDAEAAELEAVPLGCAVPALHRAAVRGWARNPHGHARLPLVRRNRHTFGSELAPVPDTDLDPEAQGPAAVALALMAVIEAYPSTSAPQAAALAGALLALEAADEPPVDPAEAADAFVRLHHALGAEAHVVSVAEDRVELAVANAPFGGGNGSPASLCHVSSGIAGQLAAQVHGTATVLVDDVLVPGGYECHLQVVLGGGDDDDAWEQPDRWSAQGAAARVPHLTLSVALPRESVSVPVVRRLATQALRAFGVDDGDVEDVRLAITEACANVIDHAGATDTYDVKVELSTEQCAITVVDQGSGFDADGVPTGAADDAEMGRGLALMRALVDNVAFLNEPQAGAVVHMVKTLNYDADHPLRRV
jgi:serine/threonine-protein kinase RsbW